MQVLQEKLTHTNSHALLSLDTSHRIIKHHESLILEKGANAAIDVAVMRLVGNFWMQISRVPELSNQSGPNSENELCTTDIRINSFIAYLLKNGFTPQTTVVELAALEQFSHPGLESSDLSVSSFRKSAEIRLNQVTINPLVP